ncbi:DUF4258 domain-containing protein [Candidatus Microgenomates bacterium]|nr:DUF4258 domain-containing protein [Candidatus Microgenomates bacterium]
MDFAQIKKFIRKKDYLFSEHADEERVEDQLTAENIEEAILSGKVIEERLDDPRGESHLIAGKTEERKLIHVVIGIRFGRPVIVTVYIPIAQKWSRGTIRKRKE